MLCCAVCVVVCSLSCGVLCLLWRGMMCGVCPDVATQFPRRCNVLCVRVVFTRCAFCVVLCCVCVASCRVVCSLCGGMLCHVWRCVLCCVVQVFPSVVSLCLRCVVALCVPIAVLEVSTISHYGEVYGPCLYLLCCVFVVLYVLCCCVSCCAIVLCVVCVLPLDRLGAEVANRKQPLR